MSCRFHMFPFFFLENHAERQFHRETVSSNNVFIHLMVSLNKSGFAPSDILPVWLGPSPFFIGFKHILVQKRPKIYPSDILTSSGPPLSQPSKMSHTTLCTVKTPNPKTTLNPEACCSKPSAPSPHPDLLNNPETPRKRTVCCWETPRKS